MLEAIHVFGNVIVLSSLIPLTLFIWLYATRSPWTQTELGVALMIQKIGLTLVMLVILNGLFLPEEWDLFRYVSRAIVYLIVVVLLWVDVVNLRRYQTGRKGLFYRAREPRQLVREK